MVTWSVTRSTSASSMFLRCSSYTRCCCCCAGAPSPCAAAALSPSGCVSWGRWATGDAAPHCSLSAAERGGGSGACSRLHRISSAKCGAQCARLLAVAKVLSASSRELKMDAQLALPHTSSTATG
eukprot:scaffold6918_cov380-Prasinococcus_capsulatus_cf.AAC.2